MNRVGTDALVAMECDIESAVRVARWFERPITRILRRHATRLGRPGIRYADDREEAWQSSETHRY